MDILENIIKELTILFESISNPLDDNHWYLSPQVHAKDFVFVNIACLVAILFGCIISPKINVRPGNNPNTILATLSAIVLIINIIANLIFKIMKGPIYIAFMLQPCHIVSAIYAYLLLTPNIRRGSIIHHFTVYYIVVTCAALAFPDTTDLIRPFETENFFVQHWALVAAPIILQTFRFPAQFRIGYAITSAGFLFMAHFTFFKLLSLITGVNINYMLSPPPVPFDMEQLIIQYTYGYAGRDQYRTVCGVLTIIASWVLGVIAIIIGNILSFILPVSSNAKAMARSMESGKNKKKIN